MLTPDDIDIPMVVVCILLVAAGILPFVFRRQLWLCDADYGRPNKSGSFFEHRLEEIAAEQTKKKS